MTLLFRPAALRTTVLAATLLLAPIAFAAKDTGKIRVRANPGDAALFINGKYAGPVSRFTVPESYEAPAGEVEISVRDPRCEDFTTKVTVRPGKTTRLGTKLKRLEPAKPPFGTFRLGGGEQESFMSVAAGDVGAVYINGKYYGYVDELNNKGTGILLNPGTYDLYVDSPTFGEIKQKITIEADKTLIVPLPKRR